MLKIKNLTFAMRADLSDKPPLLLVHGLLSSRHHWRLNQEGLRRHYRLIMAELPGHGQAPACTDPARLSPDALADELDKARRILGIPRWYVCGQSLAAGITLRLALQRPETVAAQVWTNGNRVLAPAPDAASRANDMARAQGIEDGGQSALRLLPFHPQRGGAFPADIRAQLAADADGCDLPTISALMRHTLPPMPMRDSFGALQVPTLLINGRNEKQFQPTRALAASLLPQMQVVDLAGGHAINIEAPEAFNAALCGFFDSHPL